MAIESVTDVAMILPLPVRTPAHENDLEFIDLKGYSYFFDDLERCFPQPRAAESLLSAHTATSAEIAPLAVVPVGNFEASFVPAIKDFSRLDARFRLSDTVWKNLPVYHDYGFAVFKLKPGAMTVHPMAFSFPRRDARQVFFPTVHIHDGKVHEKADFDHSLYCQPRAHERLSVFHWEESSRHPAGVMKITRTKGIILPDQHCFKLQMRGHLANRDTLLPVES
jgi:hypothetical protein